MLKNRFLTLLAILTLLTMLFTTQSGYAQGLHKHLHTQKHQQVYNDKKSDDSKDSFIQYDITDNPVLDKFREENEGVNAKKINVQGAYTVREIGRIKYQIANIVGTPLKATISESSDGEITYPREIFRCFATHLEVAETICPESLEEEEEMIYSFLNEGYLDDFEELPDFTWQKSTYISPYDRSKKTENDFSFDNKDVKTNENGKDRYKVSIDGVYKDVLREQQAAGYRTSTIHMSSYKYYERVYHMRPMESYTVRLYQGQFTYSQSGSPLYQKTSENSLAGTTKGWFYNPLPKTGQKVTPTQPRVDLYYRDLGDNYSDKDYSLYAPLHHAFVIITDPYGDEYYIGGGPKDGNILTGSLRAHVDYFGSRDTRNTKEGYMNIVDGIRQTQRKSGIADPLNDFGSYTTKVDLAKDNLLDYKKHREDMISDILNNADSNINYAEHGWTGHVTEGSSGFFNKMLAAIDFVGKVNRADVSYKPVPLLHSANSNSVAFQVIEHMGYNKPKYVAGDFDRAPGHDTEITIDNNVIWQNIDSPYENANKE